MRSLILAGGLALVLGASALAQPSEPAPYIAAALADPGRPAADVERDAARRAAEILAFTGVEPGDHVADLVIGGGYFTRLFSVAVGPDGRVTAWQPGEFVSFQASYGQQLRDVAENRELGDVTTLTDSSVMNIIKEKLPAAPSED